MKATGISVLAALLLPACNQFGGSARQLNRAEEFLSQGDYSAATVTLRTLAKKDPGNAQALVLLARTQRLQGDMTAASSSLDAAAKAGAEAAQVASLRAEISLDEGKAQDLLTGLEAGSPLGAADQQRFRARALLALRRPIEALAIVDQQLGKEPGDSSLLVLAAQSHAMLGRTILAGRLVDQAIEKDSKSPHAWLMRSTLVQDSDPERSIKSLESALSFAPAHLGTVEQMAILVRLATAALKAGDAVAAKVAQASMLKLAPQSPLVVLIGAQVQQLEGRPGEAVSMLQRLVQKGPDLAPVRAALVGALMANGSYELALHDLSAGLGPQADPKQIDMLRAQIRQAADAAPGGDEQVLNSAAVAMLLEQPVAAAYILSQAGKARPDSIALSLAAIGLNLRTGQVKQALERARSLAQGHATDPAVQEVLAQAQSANGDHISASRTYEAIWRARPTGPLAIAYSQSLVRAQGADPQAPLAKWLLDHPQDVSVRLALAETARQLGQTARAAAEYERVVAKLPQSAIVLNNLAGLYQRLNDSRSAETARRAYELGENLPSVADTYGWILVDSGNFQAAIPILSRAVAANLGDPDIRYHLGAALMKAGGANNRKQARLVLADLLRDERPFPWRKDVELLLATVAGGPD